jgi:hypothetical protein
MSKINFLKIKNNPFVFLLILLLFANSNAQDVQKVGTSAASFLRIPVGSAGTAMGSAFVSMANDASAMFWNPSGLARLDRNSLLVDYTSWLPGLNFSYFGLALPFGAVGTVGFNVTALISDEMEVTTIDEPMGTNEFFSTNHIAVGIAYASNLTDRFSIGANFKYIHESILNSSAKGFAIDIGTIYTTPFDGIRLGVSVSNFGTNMRIDGEDLNVRVDIAPDQEGNNQSIVGRIRTDDFNLPLIMRVGLSWDLIQSEQNRFTVAVDGLNPNDNAQSVNVGAEYAAFGDLLLLRGGFNDLFLEDRIKGWTFGAAFNLDIPGGIGVNAGYSYQYFEYLSGINRFSIALKF